MWRGLILALALVTGVLLGTAPAISAVQICLRLSMHCGAPHLVSTLGSSVSPQKLSASEYAPVTWGLFGKFATSDWTHLPALRELEVDIDKDLKLNAKGYPVCKGGRRDIRDLSPKSVIEVCRAALLG